MLSASLLAALLAAAAVDGPEPTLPGAQPHADLSGLPLAERHLEAATRILGRALVRNRAYDTLAALCDDIGPRFSGTPAAEKAVAWCLDRLRADGFDAVRAEKVMVPRWIRGHCRVQLTAPHPDVVVALALGGSVGTPDGPIEAEVLPVRDFVELRALDPAEVAGKIVLFNQRMRQPSGSMSEYGRVVPLRVRGAAEAALMGAVASVTRSVGTDRYRLAHAGSMSYEDGVARIPAVTIAGEDADRIQRLRDRGLRPRLSLDLGCEIREDVPSANVVAEIRGRERPDEVVVVGGHLDSWDQGTGAIDDGAGCVIAWEAARLLKELDLVPRRTVRVVLYMNEENGLRGGRAYAADHGAELTRHVAALEADRGAGRPLGFSAGMTEPARAAVTEIGALLSGIGASRVERGGGGGADIGPLYEQGVPCLGLLQDLTGYFDYHHTDADTLDKVDPFDLSLNVAAVAVMAYVLAEMEPPLHQLGR